MRLDARRGRTDNTNLMVLHIDFSLVNMLNKCFKQTLLYVLTLRNLATVPVF